MATAGDGDSSRHDYRRADAVRRRADVRGGTAQRTRSAFCGERMARAGKHRRVHRVGRARRVDGAAAFRGHRRGRALHHQSAGHSSGLGYYITIQGSTLLNYPAMYAGALAMAILGLILYFVVDGLERWLCPWRFVS